MYKIDRGIYNCLVFIMKILTMLVAGSIAMTYIDTSGTEYWED